jgi:hypothetical protein
MKQPPTLIGLSGFAGTGKDTVRALLEEMGYTGLAFADPIRAMLRDLLTSNGISDDYLDQRALKEAIIPELGVSYRAMAQELGTGWGRSLQPDFWLRLAGAYMANITDLADGESVNFVLSDVRFLNEAEWVRARGGVIWHVVRPSVDPVRAHISELEIMSLHRDHLICNNGTLADLRRAVERALRAST